MIVDKIIKKIRNNIEIIRDLCLGQKEIAVKD